MSSPLTRGPRIIHADLRDASKEEGRGLFASKCISKGESIISLPIDFCAVLETARLADTCYNCLGERPLVATAHGEETGELKRCTGCYVVKYCDEKCHLEGWPTHKHECGIFKNLYPKILPTAARAVLRIVQAPRRKFVTEENETFKILQAHLSEITEQQRRYEEMQFCAKVVHDLSKTPLSREEVLDYLAKLDMNAFSLTTPFYDRIGLCVVPYAAFINHDCVPNAIAGFNGRRLIVKAVRQINSGDQIFISYIDSTNPYAYRQKELWQRYFFECKCGKCEQKGSAREDNFLSEQPDLTKLNEIEQKALEILETARRAEKPLDAVAQLESAMHILDSTLVWPITRQPYIQIRDELIVSLLEGERFYSAFIQATIRYLRVDPIVFSDPVDNEPYHPLRHVHAWALAKLAIHISQGAEVARSETADLQKYEINYALIIYSLLDRLRRSSYDLSLAHYTYVAKFDEVCEAFTAQRLDPDTMTVEIAAEWSKMAKMADEALQKA